MDFVTYKNLDTKILKFIMVDMTSICNVHALHMPCMLIISGGMYNFRVNNNYYVKIQSSSKISLIKIKNNVHFYYAIFVIFSSFPEDAIPIGRGRA